MNIEELPQEQDFFSLLDAEAKMVNAFYKDQLSSMVKEFNQITTLLVNKGVLEEYVPLKKKGFASRLERELHRRNVSLDLIKLSENVEYDATSPFIPAPVKKYSNRYKE